LSDLDRIINFMLNWMDLDNVFPSNKTQLSSVPDSLKKVDAMLGAFWDDPPYPFKPAKFNHNSERGLFAVQDYIIDPRKQKSKSDELTGLVGENQGVWYFSYDKENRLYFRGDWFVGDISSSDTPTLFPAEIEDVLCFALLGNFFWYVDGAYDESADWQEIYSPDDKWPEDITVELWHHSAWNPYKGFWTNEDGSALLYDGMGFFRRSEND